MPPPDSDYPRDADVQRLVGVIFAESASKHSGGGENADEERAIGVTFLNAAHYARTKAVAGKKCYNDAFGDGTILSAIKTMAVAYNSPAWKKVMDGNRLKHDAELAKLVPDDAEHLRLSVEAVKAIGALQGPKSMPVLGNKSPVNFNKAANSPSSPRMEKIGKLGAHTFYGFKAGRECQ